jgi:hypothetical protein
MNPSWTRAKFAALSSKTTLSESFGPGWRLFAKLDGNVPHKQGTGPASAQMTAFDRSGVTSVTTNNIASAAVLR